jgi:hypothetical protein
MKLSLIAILVIAALPCFAQSTAVKQVPFSVWSVHSPDIPVVERSPYPLGVLTPGQTIVVSRVEALSNKGPSLGTWPSGEPIPCTIQYVLQLTNGAVTHTVPLSNAFLHNKTSQTYTDSGPIRVEFQAGTRIVLSMIAPKPQFPPVSCIIMGLDITVQYQLVAPKKTPSSEEANP